MPNDVGRDGKAGCPRRWHGRSEYLNRHSQQSERVKRAEWAWWADAATRTGVEIGPDLATSAAEKPGIDVPQSAGEANGP